MATQPQTVLHATMSDAARMRVSIWLLLCLFCVALMVALGGLTRLTESGLSIVEWKPIEGIVPPLSNEAFQVEFDNYKTSPQFKKSFPDMTLPEFRHIYWLEYFHRLLGRFAGVVFLLPLLLFAAARTLPWKNTVKLTCIFALGGAQGLIGWYMVKSGLVDDPRVSQYRLALHLAMGFLLFGLILWQYLSLSSPSPSRGGFELPPPGLGIKLFACIVVALIFVQVTLGALVAGLHAGLAYNTFPLMDGQWVPDGIAPFTPWYLNLFEDPTTVQFIHRCMAYTLGAAIPVFWFVGRNNPHVAHLLPILFSIFIVQFLLGVLTLLFVVPVPLASLHQVNALLLFCIAVATLHRLFIPLKTIVFDVDVKSALA